MYKSDFSELGVDGKYLEDILNTPIQTYEVEHVEKLPCLRSRLFKFNIAPVIGSPFSIFVKDAFEGQNNSKDSYRDGELEKNELYFLIFGREHNTFTPRYLGHKMYKDLHGIEHVLIFMTYYNQSLEDMLLEKKPCPEFNLAQRSIDKILVNGFIAKREGYRTESAIGTPTIYEMNDVYITEIINKALYGLVLNKFGVKSDSHNRVLTPDQVKKFLKWCGEHDYKSIKDKLFDSIQSKLSKPSDILVPLDLQPANILIDRSIPDSYVSSDILKLINGEELDAKDSIRITDNCRIGSAPLSAVAFLVNHPAFHFSNDQMKQLAEHTLLQYERLKQNKGIGLQDLEWKRREEHDLEWAAASRLAWLYRLSFITWLNINHPEKATELAKKKSIYNPKSYISSAVECFTQINTPHFEDVHKGLKSLSNGS